MQEEWASKSLRVERERAFRDARSAARNARMYPDGVPADEPAPDRKSERQRRAMIGTVGIVGALLLFRLTGPLDRVVDWPTPMVYALSGAIAGGVFGALSKAKNRALYALQIGAAAVIVGAVFVFLHSRAAIGPPFYWWQD